MRFGHFDDQNKEYVITTRRPRCPGSTTLAVRIFSLVSNTAGGYSFTAMRGCAG